VEADVEAIEEELPAVKEGLSGLVDSFGIRFTQSSVSTTFRDGRSMQETVDALRSGELSPSELPAIRVFQRGGSIYTLDNRRLFVSQMARVPVNVTPATASQIAQEAWKFTTPNEGCIVCVKGAPIN
jgi:hypothetical protein